MFTYNQYNEQETETTAGLAASVLTLRRDGVGRPAGYCLDYAGSPALQTAWAYDAYGRLSSVSLNAVGKPFTYGYNEETGLLDTLDYPNTLKRWRTLEEKRDLPVKIDYLRPGSANYPAKTDYSYDILGRPVTKKDYFNAPAPDLTHTCAYDDRNELVSDAMSRGGTYSYSYDNIGNRKTSLEGTDSLPTTYVANRVNQYTDITEGEEAPFVPNYDADGNQTKLRTATGEWEASYNALNQAVSFIQGDRRIECVYDYLNRRVEKSVYEGESLMSRKRFIYHGYLQIAELDATEVLESVAPVLRKTYLWDPQEPVATRILAMGVFDETGAYVEDLYYTHDALKNTTALFGIKAGRRALYEYGPYGSAVKMEGNAAELNPFRFSSEYADDELGLVYYNYRYYNPQNGRWISRDPMTEKESYLLYGYVNNMPTLYSDELGLARTITTNKDDCSINVSLNIVIYPKGGDSINNIEMRTTAQRIKQSIESNWNGYEKGCCVVNVTADVSVQSRKSRWLYRFLNSDENNIEITSDSSHRSYVNGVGGRYGVWGSQAVPWVYAHEAGHLMGLSDDYQDVANSDGSLTSVPNAGHEGHIMGEYGGKANQHEIDAILKNIECPCDENQ
ncbi:RHS repeat-associated core domain-containing protein [Akkermansia muciniphila]|nr:RHS repeat-associated core domain-containing protein [Akkermansia muciniphila]